MPRITPVQHSELQAVDVIPDRFSMAKSNISRKVHQSIRSTKFEEFSMRYHNLYTVYTKRHHLISPTAERTGRILPIVLENARFRSKNK